jgi:predicted negative regulator of RcsB-dependent stress response
MPKVEKSSSSPAINPINDSNIEGLMTETLAKVYLAQKKYENALVAYRILSLKNPEKSSFFADQITKIEQLQKNKS